VESAIFASANNLRPVAKRKVSKFKGAKSGLLQSCGSSFF